MRTHAVEKVGDNLLLLSQCLIIGLFLLRMHERYGRKNILFVLFIARFGPFSRSMQAYTFYL